ncbi:MAG: NADH-quinone oxidoreductase subunit I [Candidatus Omnitrophica bacterium]|nr:NADH-quinone oxidoreductase subunit I [Candidatus Omnitrophota bacterium]
MQAMKKYIKNVVDGFVTVLVGMTVTGREFVEHKERVTTLQYPKHRKQMPPRFRGMLFNDVNKCIACLLCAKDCPVDCIVVTGVGKGKDRRPDVFTIDFNKCMWCNLCVEVCPVESLYMTHEYEVTFRDRREMFVDFMKYQQAPPRPLGWEKAPEAQAVGKNAKIPEAEPEPEASEEKPSTEE